MGKSGLGIIAEAWFKPKHAFRIKLLGDKLSARSFQSQMNKIHARVADLNKFMELGRAHTQVVT